MPDHPFHHNVDLDDLDVDLDHLDVDLDHLDHHSDRLHDVDHLADDEHHHQLHHLAGRRHDVAWRFRRVRHREFPGKRRHSSVADCPPLAGRSVECFSSLAPACSPVW